MTIIDMDIQVIVQAVLELSNKDLKRKDFIRKLKEKEKYAADDVKIAMTSILVKRKGMLNTEPSIEACISYFDVIRIFLDDLRFGREVVLSCEEVFLGINDVLRFVAKTLNDYSMQLIVQKCFKLVQRVLNFLSHHLITFMNRAENLEELEENVEYFLMAKHAPIDVTSIAAIVLVQVWNFKEEIRKWNLLFDPSGDLQKIALINALLSSCSPKFISALVKPHGFMSLIEIVLDISSGTPKNTLALIAARTVESWFSMFFKNCQAIDTESEQARSCYGNESCYLKPLLDRLLMEVLLNTDHSIDVVRYSSRRSLEGAVTVYSKRFGKEAASVLMVKFSEQSPHSSRRRYISLMHAVLLEAEPALKWIQANADHLIQQSENPNYGPAAKECLSTSLKWSAQNLDKQTFARRWLRPLITEYELLQSHALYPLVEQAVKDSKVGFEDIETDKLEVALVFLLVCKRNGIEVSKEDEIFVLQNLLICADHKVRLNCLRLIIASPKTSEHIDRSYLELIQQALHLNFFSQSSDFRHQFIGIMKKLIGRLAAGAHNLFFIKWLWDICIKFTVSSQSFTRCTVFQILKLLQEQFSRSDGSDTVIQLSLADFILLMEGINDSYEENQIITLNILSATKIIGDGTNPVDIIKDASSELYEKAFDDITSIRPPTTLAGTILLRLLVRKGCYPRDVKKSETPLYIVVQKLIHMLEDQVIIGKQSLLEAAATKPFYGPIYAIRSLLIDSWLRDSHTLCGLKSLVIRALELSKEVCILVMKVISSSSPEGHMPMDLEQVCGSKMMDNLSQEGVSIETHGLEPLPVSSQLLLVCCWRSVREVSLLIGHLTSNLPLGNSGTDLLSADSCLHYSQLLLNTLLDSRHRGAFEQAGVGFTMVCTAFFKSNQSELCERPRFWLENMLHELQSGTDVSQYCATRRSAGLPYMVLGILHGELSVSSSILFTDAMTKLLNIIENRASLNSKIHAYNILRVLFRDTKLAQVVHPFIADGLRLAIIGTRSSLWIERNASTLMFSALMTRVFGVNRPADPANRSAGITWKIFFQKYPALYSFLLTEFSTLVKDVDQNLYPSLFPILLLLSRFQPSVAIFESSILKESAFVPYVMDCASSPVMKVRSLAARVLPGIVDSRNLEEILKTLCTKSLEHKGMNRLHGILLQVHSVLGLVSLSDDEATKKYQFFSHWLSKCLCLLSPEVPADLSLIALKILQENVHFLSSNKNNILSRTLALLQDKNSRPSLKILQSQCICLYFQIEIQEIMTSQQMEVGLDLEGIFRIHFDSVYEVRRSILDNLVYNIKMKLIPSSGFELIRQLASKLLMEDDEVALGKGIKALSLCGYIPKHTELEKLRFIYCCNVNEELKACIISILGVTSQMLCKNIDLLFEGLRFGNSLLLRKAVMEQLESHKTILEELFAKDVHKRIWLILVHSLEDDEEAIALTAAQLVTPFLKNMDSLTPRNGKCLRVCADNVATINPYWCIEAIIQFLKTKGRNDTLLMLEESSRIVDDVEPEEAYPNDEGKVFTKSQTGCQFYFIDCLRKQRDSEQQQ